MTSPFDPCVMLLFSASSPSGFASPRHERLVLLRLLFYSNNHSLRSIRVPLTFHGLPSLLLSAPVSCSPSPQFLILQTLRTFSPPLSSLSLSQSRTEINPNVSPFSAVSHHHFTRPSCPARVRFCILSFRYCTRLILIRLLCCSHNHALASFLISLSFRRLRSLLSSTSVSSSSSSRFLYLQASPNNCTPVWSSFVCSLLALSYIDSNRNPPPCSADSHHFSFQPPCPARLLAALFSKLAHVWSSSVCTFARRITH